MSSPYRDAPDIEPDQVYVEHQCHQCGRSKYAEVGQLPVEVSALGGLIRWRRIKVLGHESPDIVEHTLCGACQPRGLRDE